MGQCLTPNKAETSKEKKNVAQTGAEMIFSILMLSSVQLNLLVCVSSYVRGSHSKRVFKNEINST